MINNALYLLYTMSSLVGWVVLGFSLILRKTKLISFAIIIVSLKFVFCHYTFNGKFTFNNSKAAILIWSDHGGTIGGDTSSFSAVSHINIVVDNGLELFSTMYICGCSAILFSHSQTNIFLLSAINTSNGSITYEMIIAF